jgi:hypothetical protein
MLRAHWRATLAAALMGALAASVGSHVALAATKSVKLPPVPARAVELDRARPAETWNSQFCRRWTDGCSRCFKPVAIGNQAVCEAEATSEACSSSRVRCLEFDPVVAPLFCSGLSDGCGAENVGASGTGELYVASHDYCLLRREVRPPVDWVCGTARQVREDCRPVPKGHQSAKECVRTRLEGLRHYRRVMERLIRDSHRLDSR